MIEFDQDVDEYCVGRNDHFSMVLNICYNTFFSRFFEFECVELFSIKQTMMSKVLKYGLVIMSELNSNTKKKL